MIIEKVDSGRECFCDYKLDGFVLTIGGVEIDLAAEEDEQEKTITLGKCNGVIHRGLTQRCVYIADVIIPPRKYETTETENDTEKDSGDKGEGGTMRNNIVNIIALPLDTESVKLRLWPVIDTAENEINQTTEEKNGVK